MAKSAEKPVAEPEFPMYIDEGAQMQSEANIQLSMFDKGVTSSQTLNKFEDKVSNQSFHKGNSSSALSSGTKPSARTAKRGQLLMNARKPNQSLLGRYNRNMTLSATQIKL